MQKRLTMELVPTTAWWSNVRSNVSKADWEKCKKYARSKSVDCFICGQNGIQQGWRYPIEAHEIWEYDDDFQIQTLVDIWPLCPLCHQVKHLGRLRSFNDFPKFQRAVEHLQAVNQWPGWKVETYVDNQFEIHRLRSSHEWALDITFLVNGVGLEIPKTYFPAGARS